jgi:hypothetical protein
MGTEGLSAEELVVEDGIVEAEAEAELPTEGEADESKAGGKDN